MTLAFFKLKGCLAQVSSVIIGLQLSMQKMQEPIAFNILSFMVIELQEGYHTKEVEVLQAFVWHVLVDQHFFIPFNAKPQKSDKVYMLKFCSKYNLILKLLKPLRRCFRKLFHCYFLSIW
jgi:hypothetical protein